MTLRSPAPEWQPMVKVVGRDAAARRNAMELLARVLEERGIPRQRIDTHDITITDGFSPQGEALVVNVRRSSLPRWTPVHSSKQALRWGLGVLRSHGPKRTVPDVVGRLYGGAGQELFVAGFRSTISLVRDGAQPSGSVIRQAPVSGVKARAGSDVGVDVAIPPAMRVEVPS